MKSCCNVINVSLIREETQLIVFLKPFNLPKSKRGMFRYRHSVFATATAFSLPLQRFSLPPQLFRYRHSPCVAASAGSLRLQQYTCGLSSSPELGTRHHSSNNVNMCFSTTKMLVIASCLYSLRLLHLDSETLKFFILFGSLKLSYVVALSALSKVYHFIICFLPHF